MSKLDDELKEAIDKYVGADVLTEDFKEQTFKKIVTALDAKSVELLDIVIHLEKPLNDTVNPTGRRHAIQLLAECLRDASQLKLNFKHVETFANFFCSKLGDWQCVEGAVGGILVLLRRYSATVRTLRHEGDGGKDEPLALHLARSIFKEVHTPSHTQSVRKMVLDTANLFMDDWHEELAELGTQLGEGIAAGIEEERDPRNLLVSFNVARKVLADFPPVCVNNETLVSLFESLSSYFPITFTPPPGDKIGITGDDLRSGLGQALASTPRLAEQVVPFLLDASRDLESDSDDTVKQAADMLSKCLVAYGPKIAQAHLKDILETAQDQVCRTATTCRAEFCSMVTSALGVALKGVPAGLHPHWLSKDVGPAMKKLAEDASLGRTSLASEGARSLLLAAAAAHPVMLERCWAEQVPLLLQKPAGSAESTPASLPKDALAFMLDFVKLVKEGTLASKQLKTALAGSMEALRSILPGAVPVDAADEESDKPKLFSTAVELVALLSRLAGESNSEDAFRCLRSALLPRSRGAGASDVWAESWRAELSGAPANDSCVAALLKAICDVASDQACRACELAPALLDMSPSESSYVEWLPSAVPKLLAVTALSVARAAHAPLKEGEDSSKREEYEATATALLVKAAESFRQRRPRARFEVLAAFADVLEFPAAAKEVTMRAAGWAAAKLATGLELPSKVPALVEGLSTDCETGVPSLTLVAQRAEESRCFIRSLSKCLPPSEASALHQRVPEILAGAAGNALADCAALLPGVLPEACEAHWELCRRAMPAVCRCASGAEPGVSSAAAESLALEALEALVKTCPETEVPSFLESFRDTFGQLLTGEGKAVEPLAARGGASCWAAATAALLRRQGSCAAQAASFLEALLQALDKETPVGPFVPAAFQVLAPAQVDATRSVRAKLPPLALQQLSQTVLPSLVTRAKANGTTAWSKRAALESAVSLLSALPPEVACSDCGDELRWCTLIGLKRLKEETLGPAVDPSMEAAVFAAQVLQLLIRSTTRSLPWVEDELHSVVVPCCEMGARHRVPLVRLGCFQVLKVLLQQSFGHMAPFKKQLQVACAKGKNDPCREVRLIAIAALNTWHCMGSAQ